MFSLYSGKPGSSKTSHVIAKYMDVTDRKIYYRGIRDLKLDWTELDDDQARNWRDNTEEGSIIIIDEAQELFPVRPAGSVVPEGLKALERHRHYGYDIIFITLDPSLLDVHARKIANEHYHYVRPFGAPYAIQYHNGSGYSNPENKSALSNCNKSKKPLPKKSWGVYHSAETHTHKFKPPKVLFFLPVVFAVAAFAFYLFISDMSDGGMTDSGVTIGQPSNNDFSSFSGSSGVSVTADWSVLFKPEVRGLPFTAPLYRAEATKIKQVPIVQGCMSMRSDFADCSCYTQQGTRIADMPLSMCQVILRDGIFNHLAADQKEEKREVSKQREESTAQG